MYFYKKGKGRYRKAPAGRAEGRARLGRAQGARSRADRGVGRGARRAAACPSALRAKLPMLLYRPDKNALEWKALAAACEAAQDQSAGAARGVRRDSVDARLSLRSLPRRGVSARHRVSRLGRAAGAARAAARRRARVLDRRRDDDRDRRRVLGARAAPTATIEIGIHIACPALAIPRGSALDAHRARAAVDRLHAGPQDHDAARRGGRARSRWRPGAPRPALSLYVEIDARRRAGRARDARRARARRRQPAPRRDRRCVRERAAVARRSAVDRTSCACCGSSRSTSSAARGKTDVNRDRLQLRRRLGRGARTAACRSCRASAAPRSTSWSPS